MKEITVQAAAGNLARVTAFVNETLRKMGCSTRNRVDIDVAIDEIFANIVTYGYGTTKGLITIRVETTEAPRSVVITFLTAESSLIRSLHLNLISVFR